MKLLEKISALAGKYMAIIVLAITALSLAVPPAMTWVKTTWVNPLLMIVMLGMGLTMKLSDFKECFMKPKGVIGQTILRFVVTPLIALGLSKLFRLSPELTVGFILVAVCPGGTSSNVMTFLAKGDVALSISMTAVSTCLSPVLTPMLTLLLVGERLNVSFWSMFISIIKVVAIPIILGVVVNKVLPAVSEKLQKVLNVAGECFAKMKAGDATFSAIKKFVVKVAGYNMNNANEGFIYHPNTLADPSDPQSYTYLIPDGVTLMGGYYEGEQQTVSQTTGTVTTQTIKLVGYNWYDDHRNVWDGWRKQADGTLANSRTVLSAVAKLPATSTVDRIVGHHAVTFGSWPTDDLQKWSQEAVSSSATIDGCFIVGGEAITNDGHKALGGAAIVPKNAHVRNCVISHNKAVRGGGLYLMPGAIVSGTMIDENEARTGAGMYVDNGDTKDGTADNRAYVMSTTIVRNTAENTGGGIFFEEGALMAANCVVWGNSAASDKNLSGISDKGFEDTKLYGSVSGNKAATGREYPFNDCFIETFKLKSKHPNISMTSENTRYFLSVSSVAFPLARILRMYSRALPSELNGV